MRRWPGGDPQRRCRPAGRPEATLRGLTDKEVVLGEERRGCRVVAEHECLCGAYFDDAIEVLDWAGATVVAFVSGVFARGAGPVLSCPILRS